MLKGLGDIGQLMKLQREFKNTQKKIAKMQAEGFSSGNEVKSVVNGEYKLIDITFDEEFINSKDSASIRKKVLESVNDAVERVKSESAAEMGKLTGGLDVPGLANMLK